MEATSLAPFLAALDDKDRRAFLARYAAELEDAYPRAPDGSVLIRLRRLFVLAPRFKGAPAYPLGFAFIARAKSASSIRSAISRK